MLPPVSTTRATLRHAIVYSGAALASRAIGLLMLPLYAHALRGHGYAVIGMLDVGLSFLASLLAFGLQGAIVRLYHDEKDPARKPVVVSTGTILIGVATGVLVLPMMLLSKPLASLLVADAALAHLVILALISFLIDMVGQAAAAWLLIRSRSQLMGVISLAKLLLGVALNIELILRRGLGLDGYFVAGLLVNLAGAIVFVALAVRDCGTRYDREISGRIRSLMLPLVPGALAGWLGRQAERVLARGLISLESVGILEMAYRFPVMISLVITTPFIQSWDTRRFEIADQPDAPQTIARMFTWFTFIIVWVGLVMAVVIQPVLELLTPPEFHMAYRIARIEIITTILQGMHAHLVFGLFYAKATATISKLRIITTVAKLLLSWVFIASWGINGAALSAAVMGLIALSLDFHFSQKHYRLPMEWRKLGVIIGVALAVFFVLANWDVKATALFGWIDGSLMPRLQDALAGTPLAEWRDGRLVRALRDNSEPLTGILLKGVIAACFGALLPFVHRPLRDKWLAAARRLVVRRTAA